MDISGTNELYLLERTRVPLWLIPDSAGTPTVMNPQPLLLKTGYVRSSSEQDMQVGNDQLATDRWLLAFVPCADGPPYRSALMFIFDKEMKNLSWQDGPHIRHGHTMRLYRPATKEFSLNWSSDARMEKYGFFLTGPVGNGSLWRLFRAETDVFDRWILTLAPVRLSSRCPEADFSSFKADLLASELSAQYADLANALTSNSYREVVTKAKNIVEAIIAAKLNKINKGRDLFENLQTIKELLDKQRDSCEWTHLEYHLANKIRLVHGQTHATAPAKMGRPLRPEFALSTVEDLIELLVIWGYCEPV